MMSAPVPVMTMITMTIPVIVAMVTILIMLPLLMMVVVVLTLGFLEKKRDLHGGRLSWTWAGLVLHRHFLVTGAAVGR